MGADSVTAIVVIVSSMSALASCTVLASYAFMTDRPKLTDPSSMIIFLTLSDLALSLVAMMSMRGVDRAVLDGSEYKMCTSKVILLIYFSFSSFLWTAAMSHSSHVAVKNLFTVWGQRTGSSFRAIDNNGPAFNYATRYQIVCWCVPIIFCVIFAQEGMGNVGGIDGRVCWFIVSTDWSKVAAVCTLIPLGLIQLYNLYVLRYFAVTLRHFPASDELISALKRSLLIRTLSKLSLLLAFILATNMSFQHTPSQYYFKDDDSRSAARGASQWLVTMFIFLSPSIQGFVDAFVFFESRIRCFRGRVDLQRLSSREDSELDNTGSSVMIGQQKIPTRDDCDEEAEIEISFQDLHARGSSSSHLQYTTYAGVNSKSDDGLLGGEDGTSFAHGSDGILEMDKLSEYHDDDEMDEIYLDSASEHNTTRVGDFSYNPMRNGSL